MPEPKPMITISALAAAVIVATAHWHPARAQEVAPDNAACLARPTVTCAVEMALAASAASNEDHERSRLLVRTADRLTEIDARKIYLDKAAARFFSDSSPADFFLDRKRRVVDIAAALVAGDDAGAGRRLDEVQNFQLWWETLGDVIDTLARNGRPDLAVGLEARYHATERVNVIDAFGRDLGKQVWDTRQLLAGALVRCDCGPDPLPMVLELPEQADRLELAPVLHARRHDVDGLMTLLTGELGGLEGIEDETRRNRVGYAVGLMAGELPLRDVPAFLQRKPAWLTAGDLKGSDYGSALARAIEAGDRAAVAALVELQARDDIVWLSGDTIRAPDAAAKVADLLPRLERDNLLLMRTKSLLANGDARKTLGELMNSSVADAWHAPELDIDDGAAFDFFVIDPLLARGAFDAAEEAVLQVGDADARAGMLAAIATARDAGSSAAQESAADMLADCWITFRQADGTSDAGRSFLFAVRDLIRSQPDAFPFQ